MQQIRIILNQGIMSIKITKR